MMFDMLIANIVECIINDTDGRRNDASFLTGHSIEAIDDDYCWVLTRDNV